MASGDTVNPTLSQGRAAWAAAAVGLALAVGGGWLLNRPTAAPAPTAGAAAAPDPGLLEAPHTEAKAEAAAARQPAASMAAPVAVARPSLPMPTASQSDELHKMRLVLEGSASPQGTLEAAKLLSSCRYADAMLETMYRMRDQPAPEGQQDNEATRFPNAEQIAGQRDLQRRCQVFDAATLAREGELLQRAYEGGAKDVLHHLHWLNSDGRQEAKPELLAKLQREARRMAEDGDFLALAAYSHAFDPAALGATPMQRQAYKEALLRILGATSGAAEKASRASMDDLEKMMWGSAPPPLSAEQQREADALTERVVEAWRKLHGRGG